jgi:hypothetical protein
MAAAQTQCRCAAEERWRRAITISHAQMRRNVALAQHAEKNASESS